MKRVYGVDHLVIGTSATNPGILADQVAELQDLMYTSFFHGVTGQYSEFSDTLVVVEKSEELSRRRRAEQKRGVVREASRASFKMKRNFSSVKPLVEQELSSKHTTAHHASIPSTEDVHSDKPTCKVTPSQDH